MLQQVGQFISRFQNIESRQAVASCYVAAATSVISGCALFALVKYRVVHKVLPGALAAKLDSVVNRVAELTEPKGMTRMADAQDKVSYLQAVYGQATVGFLLGGLGTYLFVKMPRLPVVPAIVMTGISFATLVLGPRKLLTPKQAQATFAATCILGGISLGPMNWIARETNSVLFATAMSSTLALTVAPLITRGWIANALLSQALSSSIALLAVKFIALRTFPKLNGKFADPAVDPQDKLFEFITTPLGLDNLLLIQAAGNAVLALTHVAPILSGTEIIRVPLLFDNAQNSVEGAYSQRDAIVIVAAVSYSVVRLFQACVEKIARAIKNGAFKDKKAAIATAVNASSASDVDRSIEKLAGGVSTLSFMFMYVKFVQMVQASDDPQKSFRWLSKIFNYLTPVRIVTKK